MTRPLARLRVLLPAPDPAATERAAVDWAAVTSSLGVRLPRDYRDFIDVYGPGTIDDQLDIAAPLGPGDDVDAPSVLELTPKPSSTNWLKATGSEYPLWPEPGALLAWGRYRAEDDTYGFLYWLTVGDDPDAWPVVTWRREAARFVQHPPGMVAHLVRLLEESPAVPLIFREVFGAPDSRFIRADLLKQRLAAGDDPWEYLEDLHAAFGDEGEFPPA